MKNRAITKIISSVLCAAITLQVGLALTVERVNADGIPSVEVTVNGDIGNIVTITSTNGGCEYIIDSGENDEGYVITCSSDSTINTTVDSIGRLSLVGNSIVRLRKGFTGELAFSGLMAQLEISYCEVNCTGLYSDGNLANIINSGDFRYDKYVASEHPDFVIRTGVYFRANDLDISEAVSGRFRGTYSGAKYFVENSFYNGADDLTGIVVAQPDTVISSKGGSFTLQVGNATKLITGAFTNKTANELLDDPNVQLDFANLPDGTAGVLCGQNYNFDKYLSVADGYDKSLVYYEYSTDRSTVLAEKPSSYGINYYVRAVAPYYGSFREAQTDWMPYAIGYLAQSDVTNYPDHFTISGVRGNDAKYVSDKIVLTPVDGYLIGCPSLPGFEDYSTSVSIAENDLFNSDNTFNDFDVVFVREEDGAITDGRSISFLIPTIRNYVFDYNDPSIEAYYYEPMGDNINGYRKKTVQLNDNPVIVVPENARSFMVHITDDNLESVVLYKNNNPENILISDNSCELSLQYGWTENNTGIEYKIVATDHAGRETEVEFVLTSAPIDPDLTVTLPEAIYVGDEYEPEISTNSNGEKHVTYNYTDRNLVTTTPPTAAGTYQLNVTVDATSQYNEKTFSTTYEILKKTTTATVSVANINVGETVDPIVTTVSDGKAGAAFEYKLSTAPEDDYSDTVPAAAGTYSVRATIPETDTYLEITCENTFTISRNEVGATVSVADIFIGGTIEPAVATDSDGKEDASFEYKLSTAPEDDYSDTVPTAAGTYSIRATIPETDTYEEIVCEGTFTIHKLTVEANVTVENITVGGTIEPVVVTDSDGKEAVSFKYKRSTAPEDDYSDTVPSAAGTYSVRATIPETDTYKKIVCEGSFTISKNAATATVTVTDFFVGGTVNPVVDSISDGKASATFEYKPSTAPEDDYSDTVPTAAGEYSVRATIPETDTYLEITCENTFTINKNAATATVTVADIFVGGTVNPVVDSISDGKTSATFEYKLSDADDEEYSDTVPTAAGDYSIRATIPETDTYVEITCENTLTISKNTPSLSIKIPDTIYVGDTIDVEVITPSTGEQSIRYMDLEGERIPHFVSYPQSAGAYILYVDIAETDYYEAVYDRIDFEVIKKTPTISVSVPDVLVGESLEPTIETDSDARSAVYEYKLKDDPDSAFTDTQPEYEGVYTVRATIPETDRYLSNTCTSDFTISLNQIPSSAAVSVEDITVGGTVNAVMTDVPEDYDGTITIEYKSDEDEDYSTTIPTAAGTYTVRATLSATVKYTSAVRTDTFTISKNDVTASVSVADIFVGETPNPVVTTVSDGKVTIEYKTTDTEYTTTIPTAAGEYTVRATVAESDTYLETSCSSTFTINKNEVTKASVSVADIFVGETPNPVVTTDSDGKAVFEYKISTAPDTSYTSDVPTAAGTYMVRATIPETDTYLGTTCTANFDILKNEVTASLAVADIKVGGTVKPVITINPEDYDGVVSYQYKISTAEDSMYAAVVPTAAGTYMVKATLPATDKYLGTTCTTNFDIVKNEVTASVSVDDILVGGTVKPVVTTDPEDYDGVITFEYKGSADAAFSKTVPTAAGTYTVRATLPETAKFFGTTCTNTFTISKNAVTATVSVADIFVGETPKPVVTTDPKGYDGVITFEYKESSEADTAYTSAVPTAAGRYTVRATLSSTANFLGTSCEDSFSIVRKEVTASVSVANIYVGQTPSPVVITESDGKDKATFEYKLSSDPDTAFTTTAPTKLGTYTCKATIPETDNYLAITCSCEFVINLNPVGVLELSVPDTYYGLTVSSSYNTDSDGEVSIVYKTAGAPDTTYASVAPTKVGDYTAMITVSETETYESASTTTNFKISYLEAPATAFVPKGTEGNNGYFTSDVDLTAPAGYTISTTLGSGYSGSVAYTESLGSIFLKRDDGALTAAIGISDRPKIDKVAPVISSASGVMYVDSMSISVSDKNLMSLTVNGSPVAVSGGSASVTLKRPEKGSKTFTIVAEDEAGNITTIELTLMEEWLSDRKVPEGQAVSLVAGEIYYFNEGEWIVSIVNSDGTVTECSTVFSCNLPFYVNSSGDYIFTRVT